MLRFAAAAGATQTLRPILGDLRGVMDDAAAHSFEKSFKVRSPPAVRDESSPSFSCLLCRVHDDDALK